MPLLGRVSRGSCGALAIRLILGNRRQIEGLLLLDAWIRGGDRCAANRRADSLPFEIALALQQHLLFGSNICQKLCQQRAIDADALLSVLPLLLTPFLED